MKRVFLFILTALLASVVFVGCGSEGNNKIQSISSNAEQQTNTTTYQIGSISFQIDSNFISKPTSEVSMAFLDQVQENMISVSISTNLSLEDAMQEFENETTSYSDYMDVFYKEQETIHGLEGLHLKVENKTDEGALFANTFLFQGKDHNCVMITYSSKNLNSDQIDEKLKEIIATVELDQNA